MKLHLLTTLMLIVFVTSSYAAEMPTHQWRVVQISLLDLVQRGYKLITVTTTPASDESSVAEIFFLQNGASVFKCLEYHSTDIKIKEPIALFNCFELVQPYAPPRTK